MGRDGFVRRRIATSAKPHHANPGIGDLVIGTGGLMKLRWNLPDMGKSSGIRVLYVDFMYQETVIMINCYSKTTQNTICYKEKAMYKEFIREIGMELKR